MINASLSQQIIKIRQHRCYSNTVIQASCDSSVKIAFQEDATVHWLY